MLALLLLAMAAAQLADFPGFVRVLRAYDLDDPAVWLVAVVLVAGEAAGGVLLLNRTSTIRVAGAMTALAVAIGWSALAASAFARGELITNCGCFGVHLAQPLRWWVLLEDAEFLVLGGLVVWRERGADREGRIQAPGGFPTRTAGGPPHVRSSQAQ